jgi:DNA-binding MarR family transcriptional regulator
MASEWAAAAPDLDVSPLDVAGRLLRLAAHLQRDIDATLATVDLSFGDFDVLNTLRRSGGGDGLNPTALARAALITSGAMTTRLDRLEARGLVERRPDPADRRGSIIRLTRRGRSRAEAALDLVLAADRRLVAPLSPRQTQTLVPLLRHLLSTAEQGPQQ